MENIYTLTFDLSKHNCGVALFKNGKYYYSHVADLWNDDHILRSELIQDFVSQVLTKTMYIGQRDIYNIGIELTNFKNMKVQAQHNMLAGQIIQSIVWTRSLHKNYMGEIKIKIFNSNQWQSFVGCKNSDERSVRKQKAKDFVVANYIDDKIDYNNDNITDAIAMNHFFNDITDSYKSHEEIKIRDKTEKRTKMNKKQQEIRELKRTLILSKKLYDYHNIINSGKSLSKAQERAYNDIRKELKLC